MWTILLVLTAPFFLLTLLVPSVSGVIAVATGSTFASVIPVAIPFILIGNHVVVLFGLSRVLRRQGLSFADIGWRSLASKPALVREVAIGIAVSVVLIVIVDYVVRPLLGLGVTATVDAPASLPIATRAAWFVSYLVLPPIEESLFRGYGITRLRSRVGVVAAVLMSSFFFGVLHLTAGPLEAVSAAALGLLCAAVFLARRDLVAVSVAHSIRNFVSAAGLL